MRHSLRFLLCSLSSPALAGAATPPTEGSEVLSGFACVDGSRRARLLPPGEAPIRRVLYNPPESPPESGSGGDFCAAGRISWQRFFCKGRMT